MREPDAFTRAYNRLRVRLPQDRADDGLTVIDVAAVELRAFYDELKARGRCQLALEHELDRYKAALDYLSAQYDVVVDIHSRVRMDTPEDRELHERTIAAMRFAHETVRAALQEEMDQR